MTHIRGRIEANRADDDAGFGALLAHVESGVERAHLELRQFQGSIDTTRAGIREIAGKEGAVLARMEEIVAEVAAPI